ncbi:sucrose-phosphate synthase [Sarracenia purpurea var. burkii]
MLQRSEKCFKREDVVPQDSPSIAFVEGHDARDISATLKHRVHMHRAGQQPEEEEQQQPLSKKASEKEKSTKFIKLLDHVERETNDDGVLVMSSRVSTWPVKVCAMAAWRRASIGRKREDDRTDEVPELPKLDAELFEEISSSVDGTNVVRINNEEREVQTQKKMARICTMPSILV